MSRRAALAGAVAVVAADQAVKAVVRADVPIGSTRELIPGVAELVHTENTGVSFGLLADLPAWAVGLVSIVALLVVVVLVARAVPPLAGSAAIALIGGGAIGNLIDRLARGAVTDFLDLPLLPPCNVADIAISFGAVAMAIGLLQAERADRAVGRREEQEA